MRYPKFLPEKGTIGFVAPSFGCATEPYYTAFLNAQKKFQKMGYGLDLGPNCYVAEGIGISNTPQACGSADPGTGRYVRSWQRESETPCCPPCPGLPAGWAQLPSSCRPASGR